VRNELILLYTADTVLNSAHRTPPPLSLPPPLPSPCPCLSLSVSVTLHSMYTYVQLAINGSTSKTDGSPQQHVLSVSQRNDTVMTATSRESASTTRDVAGTLAELQLSELQVKIQAR